MRMAASLGCSGRTALALPPNHLLLASHACLGTLCLFPCPGGTILSRPALAFDQPCCLPCECVALFGKSRRGALCFG
ncbi:hypothetical protein CALCODRAFT_92954 [Calocera cornea HHB12733]|uniref:Uncharacterized protein n=1 Tax=Calocera cornea HHB12733 TaxID=1353952 RepID=A0A165D939_9BASI|nr:hypothetical protein CALCODRAFT_92954 [Calocera cornea HHB12733]